MRQLTGNLFEIRIGLDVRLIFQNRAESLLFLMVGSRDKIQKFLREYQRKDAKSRRRKSSLIFRFCHEKTQRPQKSFRLISQIRANWRHSRQSFLEGEF